MFFKKARKLHTRTNFDRTASYLLYTTFTKNYRSTSKNPVLQVVCIWKFLNRIHSHIICLSKYLNVGDAGHVLFIFQDLQMVIIIKLILFLEVLHSIKEFPKLNGIVVVLICETHDFMNWFHFLGVNKILSQRRKFHEFVKAQFVIPIL